MEEQLAAYRAKKARERQASSESSFMSKWFKRKQKAAVSLSEDQKEPLLEANKRPLDKVVQKKETTSTACGGQHLPKAGTPDSTSLPYDDRLLTALKVVLWLIVWALFINVGFGAVFFVLSVLVFVYMNTRTAKRRTGEPSAYSVFNPNCERLEGTFTAEQFEKELRYGALSVH